MKNFLLHFVILGMILAVVSNVLSQVVIRDSVEISSFHDVQVMSMQQNVLQGSGELIPDNLLLYDYDGDGTYTSEEYTIFPGFVDIETCDYETYVYFGEVKFLTEYDVWAKVYINYLDGTPYSVVETTIHIPFIDINEGQTFDIVNFSDPTYNSWDEHDIILPFLTVACVSDTQIVMYTAMPNSLGPFENDTRLAFGYVEVYFDHYDCNSCDGQVKECNLIYHSYSFPTILSNVNGYNYMVYWEYEGLCYGLKGIFDHFEVTSSIETLNHSDSAAISVVPMDINNYFVQIPDDTPLCFLLDANGAQYGSLIGPDGSTADFLFDITYGDIKNGNVKYIADGDVLDSPEEVVLTVIKLDEPSGEGNVTMVVVQDLPLLTIEIPEPNEVWPDLPIGSGGNPDDRHKKQNIIVTLLQNSEPLVGQDITVSVMMQLPSGGHDHINQPPGNLLGELHEVHSGIIGIPEITAPTNADGTIEIIYTAPEFSGIFNITAEVTYLNQDLESMDVLAVRVPNLELLPDSEDYTKVGGTARHHGPPDYADDHNHYGTQYINDALELIAITWYRDFPNEHTLCINDMSLPYGGLFDVNGYWQTPHGTHRIGMDVDIRTELPPGNYPDGRPGVPVRIPRDVSDWTTTTLIYNEIFEQICI